MLLYVLAGAAVSMLIASVGTSRDRLVESLAAVATMADDIERRDERLELVLAASGTGFWEWDIRTGELRLVGGDLPPARPGSGRAGADLRALPRDDPSRRSRGVPGVDRRGPGPRLVVQPRVPPAVAGRVGPLDPRRGAGLPRTPRANRSAWSAPARTSPSGSGSKQERDQPARRGAAGRHIPRGLRRRHLARAPDADHDDLRPDPDPGPTRAASRPPRTRPS